MCYEWSGWYRRARTKDAARKPALVDKVVQRETAEIKPQAEAKPAPAKAQEKVPA
jgi:hypothetical protein